MNTNGVGLGLAISKQIAQQFEGDISLDSELGVGSTFTFRFKTYPTEEKLESEGNEVEKKCEFKSNSKKLLYKWQPSNLLQKVKYVYEQDR